MWAILLMAAELKLGKRRRLSFGLLAFSLVNKFIYSAVAIATFLH